MGVLLGNVTRSPAIALVLHGTASKGQKAGFVETCVSQDLLGLIKPTLHQAREAQDITLDKKFILVSESSEKTQF